MTDQNDRQDATIEFYHERMNNALGDLRMGMADHAEALRIIDGAIEGACSIPSLTWRDGVYKAHMLRTACMGANAVVARKVLASLQRDFENLPPRRSAEH